jgi:transposase
VLNYVNERQVEMKVFLANPHVAMDTNHLERALRVIPMGRNYVCPAKLANPIG